MGIGCYPAIDNACPQQRSVACPSCLSLLSIPYPPYPLLLLLLLRGLAVAQPRHVSALLDSRCLVSCWILQSLAGRLEPSPLLPQHRRRLPCSYTSTPSLLPRAMAPIDFFRKLKQHYSKAAGEFQNKCTSPAEPPPFLRRHLLLHFISPTLSSPLFDSLSSLTAAFARFQKKACQQSPRDQQPPYRYVTESIIIYLTLVFVLYPPPLGGVPGVGLAATHHLLSAMPMFLE